MNFVTKSRGHQGLDFFRVRVGVRGIGDIEGLDGIHTEFLSVMVDTNRIIPFVPRSTT